MANEFLNTPVLPGKPVTRYEHRHLSSVLGTVIVIAVIIIGVLWWSSGQIQPVQQQAVAPVPVIDQQALMRARIAAELASSTIHMSDAAKSKIAKELSASQITLTDAQKAAYAQQLNAK